MSDPLTLVYGAIWDILEASPELTSMVRPGCRVKYDAPRRLIAKTNISSADLPEIAVVPLYTSPHIQRTSNGSSLTKAFGIVVATGEQGVDKALFPLEWTIYRAMEGWASHLSSLKWNEKTFVKLCRPLQATESLLRREINRGVMGWSLTWACEVEMWFRTADLSFNGEEE